MALSGSRYISLWNTSAPRLRPVLARRSTSTPEYVPEVRFCPSMQFDRSSVRTSVLSCAAWLFPNPNHTGTTCACFDKSCLDGDRHEIGMVTCIFVKQHEKIHGHPGRQSWMHHTMIRQHKTASHILCAVWSLACLCTSQGITAMTPTITAHIISSNAAYANNCCKVDPRWRFPLP